MTALLGPASRMNLESRSQAAWVACELAPGGGERSADVCQPDRREALSAALLKVGGKSSAVWACLRFTAWSLVP